MRTVSDFPRKVKEIENLWIPMPDGAKLAARVWLPEDADEKPVPAILEYLPYRKRDGTIARDALTHPYLAGHGYACLRVDMRGNGDSDGVMLDEYAKQEQDDALDVIAWISHQPWCTGKLGMMGISWGGFNALQVAARKPEALKAIVTLCSTDDRYADDVHYRGGAVLSEMLGWSGTMLAYSARPPDPLLVGKAWRDIWRERLKHEPLLAIEWLKHQTRDDYWKHGSVNQNIGEIEAACLIVGGWNDAYSNAVPRLMASLRSPCKAIVGPWAHKYPHFAVPEPRIGFLQEMLRWWDFWLKGEPTGVMRDAPYRFFIIDAEPPDTDKARLKGRWVEDHLWGAGNTETKTWFLNAGGIGGAAEAEQALAVSSPQDTGTMGGEWCVIWLGPEYPGDQRDDDAKSLCFDTPELRLAMDIAGAPSLELELSVDKPVASLCARLCDVWPDGQVSRITYGLLNLTHRDSHERPEPLEPGKRYRVTLALDDIAWRIPAGHKLRVALSTAYWPIMWPAPEAATVTVHSGASLLHLPVRRDIPGEMQLGWPPAEAAEEAKLRVIAKPWHKREFTTDGETGVKRLEIVDDFGRHEIEPHGLITWSVGRETHSIHPGDPLSCMMKTHWTEELQRGRWQVRIEAMTEMRASSTQWLITGRLEAYEGRKLVFARDWDEKIARHLN